MILVDIKNMNGYEYREGFKGISSVSERKVSYKHYSTGEYPACNSHGAMQCVAIREDGKIWRCREEGCDEGCFEILRNHTYSMADVNGKTTDGWKLTYYPIFYDGKTSEVYSEPRALIEKPLKEGFDLREVPLRYLK